MDELLREGMMGLSLVIASRCRSLSCRPLPSLQDSIARLLTSCLIPCSMETEMDWMYSLCHRDHGLVDCNEKRRCVFVLVLVDEESRHVKYTTSWNS